MSKSAIEVHNIAKRFMLGRQAASGLFWGGIKNLFAGSDRSGTDFWALRGVSFQIERGQAVGVIGRNGSGKSTLLKILSRIISPTEGRAVIRGRVGSLLEVGTGFHPELTGRENIYLNGAILGMSRSVIRGKFDQIVAFSEIEKFLDTPVKRYSSGMYTRLAFSVAAHLDPDILIVDEVLAVGDAAFQQKCLGRMDEVASEGRTVLFVSHSMGAVQQFCTRGIVLRAGRVFFDGQVEQAVTEYLSDADSSTTGIYDLSNHSARERRFQPVLKQLILRNASLETGIYYRPFGQMVIDLMLHPPAAMKAPRLAISIEDQFARRITTVASYFMEKALPTVEGLSTVRCRIPQLRLGPGRYLLSVSVTDRVHGMLDAVNGAVWFEVEADACYPSNEPYHSVFGPVLCDSKWELVDTKVIA